MDKKPTKRNFKDFPDFKDFIAITLAVYQVVLLPVVLIVFGVVLFFVVLRLLLH